jgi:hypothetical protein
MSLILYLIFMIYRPSSLTWPLGCAEGEIRISMARISGTVGCKTWSLTLREEHRLRMFENRVVRRIFCPKRNLVTGGWRKLHNEELHNLYSSLNKNDQVKEDEKGRACSTKGEERNAPEGKRQLGRLRRRRVYNSKMNLRVREDGLVQTASNWLRIGSSGGLL